MVVRLIDTPAVLVAETQSSYSVGGSFQLIGGPFTELELAVNDNDDEFASFGGQYSESLGEDAQLGLLFRPDGSSIAEGLTSLKDVLTIEHPISGEEILVGRVEVYADTGNGPGTLLKDFYIFSDPIDPSVSYTIKEIDYTTGSSDENTYEYEDFSDGKVVCFTQGTQIQLASGRCAVEDLEPGMLVQTADNGLKPVLWIGKWHLGPTALSILPRLRPVRIETGMLNNDRTLLVSPLHRIAYGDGLVKAKHLPEVRGLQARVANGVRSVTYYHVLLDSHQILFANGAATESLFLGPFARDVLGAGVRTKLSDASAFDIARGFGDLCRPAIPRGRVKTLAAAEFTALR